MSVDGISRPGWDDDDPISAIQMAIPAAATTIDRRSARRWARPENDAGAASEIDCHEGSSDDVEGAFNYVGKIPTSTR